MVKCKECGREFRAITHTHLEKDHNMTPEQYIKKYPGTNMVSEETSQKLSSKLKGTKMGDNNPARRPNIKEAISKSVTQKWKNGNYDNRINGMFGKVGELSCRYKSEKRDPLFFAENNYIKFLSEYQDVTKCSRCGASNKKINIHHIDENHSNFLISNLEPLCVPCHASFHYEKRKLPFISVTKKMTFAAAHKLPFYNGPCFNWHGHEWSIRVMVTKRIDPDTGMVLDFSILKKAIQDSIILKLDHGVINEHIENPTAENMLIWCWEKLMFDSLLKGIEEVSLWETPDSCATLSVKGMLSYMSQNIEEYVKTPIGERVK